MPTPAPPRIRPLEPPYDPEAAALLERWMPPGAAVEPLALFRTLAVHRDLAGRMRPLGAGILGHGLVPAPLREVMILRTCALAGAEYEWGVHATAFAGAVGLSAEQVAATVHGDAGAEVWDDDEAAVIALADELHATGTVSDRTFGAAAQRFGDEQLLELVITAGWYRTISYVVNAARVPLEPWAARFPPPPDQ